MNILFLSCWFPYPPDVGSKIRVYYLLRALAARHNVKLLSFAFGTSWPAQSGVLRELGICDVKAIPINPFDRSLFLRAIRFFSPVPVVTLGLAPMREAVRQILAGGEPDVVIASSQVMATYAFMALPDTVKVLEEHNSMSRWMKERYQSQRAGLQRLRCWLSWQKMQRYEARLFRRFDLCTQVSQQDLEMSRRLVAAEKTRIEMIPNGVDCERNRPGPEKTASRCLIFNGALTYSANYDAMQYFLAEVYPLIKQRSPSVSLTITGSTVGVDLDGLELEDSVHLSGYVDDIRPLVRSANVCVAPIREGGGTRLKILEAMALGTPVVATHKSAEGLDVFDGKHILLADDPREFAEHTVKLLHDPQLCQRLTAEARELVERRYDWARIGDDFVDLVEEVTERRTTGRKTR